jgi:lysophospholipase L1-like esterase
MKHIPLIAAAAITGSVALSGASLASVPRCSVAQIQQAAAGASIPAAYMYPELMAVGDSLYNGVESLSISKEKAHYSIPSFVARGLNVHGYREASYDRPLLADLDVDFQSSWRHIAETLGNHVTVDIDSYTNPSRVGYFQRSKPKFFDDVAIAQADSAQLMCDTSGEGSAWIAPYYTGNVLHIPSGKFGIPHDLTTWLYEVNSRFLLNPSLDDHYKNLSQLGEVLARKPKNLLMNIGSNDGLWLMAFKGFTPNTCYDTVNYKPVSPCGPSTQSISSDMAQLVKNMRAIAQTLAPLTTHVYVNLLGPPRAVANLNPVGFARVSGKTGYFAHYETYINDTGLQTVTGADVKAMDDLVTSANRQIISNMCQVLGPRRVTFVDLFGLLSEYDAKNALNSKPTPQNSISVNVDLGQGPTAVPLDNLVLHPDPRRFQVTGGEFSLVDGGLFSLDNMHPTAFGYGLVANRVMAAMKAPIPTRGGCAVISADYRGAGAVNFASLYDELLRNKVPNAVFIEPHVHTLLELARAFLPKNAPPSLANATLQAQALKTASPGDAAAFEEVRSVFAVGTAHKSEKQH